MWIWVATFASIIASAFRALNWGYQCESYVISICAQVVFLYDSWVRQNEQQMALNVFYISTSFIGLYRWKHIKKE